MIQVKNLWFKYKKSPEMIFEDASLDVADHKIVGIVGPNGAGKTTLFDLMMGVLRPQKGAIDFAVDKNSVALQVQNVRLPYLLKNCEIVELLSALNNIDSKTGQEMFRGSLSAVENKRLDKIWDRRFGICSTGEKKWMISCLILMLSKRVYLMDEPTAGVDPEYRHLIWEKIKGAHAKGACVLVSTHALDELNRHAQEFYFVGNKKLSYFPSIDQFVDHYKAASPDEAFSRAVNYSC